MKKKSLILKSLYFICFVSVLVILASSLLIGCIESSTDTGIGSKTSSNGDANSEPAEELILENAELNISLLFPSGTALPITAKEISIYWQLPNEDVTKRKVVKLLFSKSQLSKDEVIDTLSSGNYVFGLLDDIEIEDNNYYLDEKLVTITTSQTPIVLELKQRIPATLQVGINIVSPPTQKSFVGDLELHLKNTTRQNGFYKNEVIEINQNNITSGTFEIKNLPAGSYEISVVKKPIIFKSPHQFANKETYVGYYYVGNFNNTDFVANWGNNSTTTLALEKENPTKASTLNLEVALPSSRSENYDRYIHIDVEKKTSASATDFTVPTIVTIPARSSSGKTTLELPQGDYTLKCGLETCANNAIHKSSLRSTYRNHLYKVDPANVKLNTGAAHSKTINFAALNGTISFKFNVSKPLEHFIKKVKVTFTSYEGTTQTQTGTYDKPSNSYTFNSILLPIKSPTFKIKAYDVQNTLQHEREETRSKDDVLQERTIVKELNEGHILSKGSKEERVIIIIGQSNAAGLGTKNELNTTIKDFLDGDTPRRKQLRMYWRSTILGTKDSSGNKILNPPSSEFITRSDQKWFKLHYFHQPEKYRSSGNSQNDFFGVEQSWAYSVNNKFKSAEINKGPHISFIKFAVGGTRIEENWKPNEAGGLWELFVNHYYKPAMKAIIDSGKTPKVIGIFWMQGESDAAPKADVDASIYNRNYEKYKRNLEILVNNMESDLKLTSPRIIIGEVGPRPDSDYLPDKGRSGNEVRAAQRAVINSKEHITMLPTDGRDHDGSASTDNDAGYETSDGIHYTTDSLRQMGQQLLYKLDLNGVPYNP